jgi:hypothetical protein
MSRLRWDDAMFLCSYVSNMPFVCFRDGIWWNDIDRRKTCPCYHFHHKSYMDSPEREPRLPRWESGLEWPYTHDRVTVSLYLFTLFYLYEIWFILTLLHWMFDGVSCMLLPIFCVVTKARTSLTTFSSTLLETPYISFQFVLFFVVLCNSIWINFALITFNYISYLLVS